MTYAIFNQEEAGEYEEYWQRIDAYEAHTAEVIDFAAAKALIEQRRRNLKACERTIKLGRPKK